MDDIVTGMDEIDISIDQFMNFEGLEESFPFVDLQSPLSFESPVGDLEDPMALDMIDQGCYSFNSFMQNSARSQFFDDEDEYSAGSIPTPPRSPSLERQTRCSDTAASAINNNISNNNNNISNNSNSNLFTQVKTEPEMEIKIETHSDLLPDSCFPFNYKSEFPSFCGDIIDGPFEPLLFNELDSEFFNANMWDGDNDFQIDYKGSIKSAPLYSDSANNESSLMPFDATELATNRNRTDSTSLFFDSCTEMLFPQIPDIGLDSKDSLCRPETPAESSDADSDNEEKIMCRLGNIRLDHNYYSTATIKPVPKVAPRYTRGGSLDTDEDEIDVESFEDSCILNRVCRISRLQLPESIRNSKDFPDVGATVTTISHSKAKRGRKPVHQYPKKVGRPPKVPVKRLTFNGVSNSKSGFATDCFLIQKSLSGRSATMDPSKRTLHNSLERMRRVDLKNWFDKVRSKVPSLIDKPRAPKVLILNSAAEHCESLSQLEKDLIYQKEQLRVHNANLKLQFTYLKNMACVGELG